MRYTYTLLLILLSCTMVQAQQRLTKFDNYQRYNRTGTFSLWWSEVYHYLPNNSSNNADRVEIFGRDWGASASPVQKVGETRNVLNANGKITESSMLELDGNGVLIPYEKIVYSYNSAGYLDTMTDYIADNSGNLQLYSAEKRYTNSKGLLTKMITYNYSQTVETLYLEQYLDYNANGSVMYDSSVEHDKTGSVLRIVKTHAYNTKGNIASTEEYWYYTMNSGKQLEGRSYYHYDGQGQLIVDSVLDLNIGLPEYDSKEETYYYRSSNGLLQRTEYKSTLEYRTTSAFVDHEQFTYYNAKGDVDYLISLYEENSTGSIVDDSIKYHYGTYTPGSGSNSSSNIVAYPIPSGNILNMQWPASGGVASITVRIVNSRGQIVKQWTDQANGTYYKTIDVSSLQAGNYYIVLDADGKRDTKQISIQR